MKIKSTYVSFLEMSKELTKFILKSFLLLLCTVSFALTPSKAFFQNTVVTLEYDKTFTIDEVFKLISNQTDYKFIYKSGLFDNTPKVKLNKGNIQLQKLLEKCFTETNYTYKILDSNSIIISKKTDIISSQKPTKIQVSGVVKDIEGEPIPGVFVIEKGVSNGVPTDFDGNFLITVANKESILVFSYLGFKTQEIVVRDQTSLDVILEEDVASLDAVVINALGFAVKTDKLGSAVSSIKPTAITRSGETSVANAIQGKMAGVNITRSTGDPGSGSNIRIRGVNTITGNSQPLIVVDGIPINNSYDGGGGSSSIRNGTSQQSRLNDINPNDIQSLQVLKGASAAALWGSRASNGVIVIKTKSGKRGFRVSLKTSLSIDQVSQTQKLQSNFGQGQGGVYRGGTEIQSWGDEIAARAGGEDTFITDGAFFIGDQTGRTYYPVANGTIDNPHGGKNSKETFIDDNFNRVFGTGILLDQSLSISGGDKKSSIFFSLGNTDHQGVIRNNDYQRHTLNISTSKKFNDFISLNLKGKYSRVNANRIQQNSNVAGLLLGLYRTPADFNIQDYTGSYFDASGSEVTGRHRSYRNALGQSNRPRYNNPLWTVNQQKANNIVNRHIYAADLDIFPLEGLNIKLRGGVDTYNDSRDYLYPVGSARTSTPPVSRIDGSLVLDNISETELNFDVIGKYDTELNSNISSSFLVGWNVNDRKFSRTTSYGDTNISGQDLFNLVNYSTVGSENFIRHIKSYRTYSTANFGIFDQLFVDLSGTVELASTIKGAFFYPSASAAWQISNANFYPDDSFMNFAKIRMSWGKVGVQPNAYRTGTNYEGDFRYSAAIAGGLNSIDEGGGFRLDNNAGDPNLKPEIKTEIETGVELRFFNNLLSTSFTYYSNEVNDVLLDLQGIPSLGFDEQYTNGATMKNRGFEFEFSANLLRNNEDWKFSTYGNFATNKNEVTSLAGQEVVFLTGFGIGDSVAAKGYQMGALFGGKLPRNDDGSILLDENGFPAGTPEYDVIGDPNPDWTGGLGFNVGYKNISLNVLLEHSQGGEFYDITRQINARYGLAEETGNKVRIPVGGVADVRGNFYNEGQVVRGNLRDFGAGNVLLEEQWYDGKGAGSRGFSELWLQDATWTRLREVALTYNFGSKILEKLKLSAANVGVTGRNLVLWTKVVGNDPDKNFAGVGNSRGLDYFTNPTTRSFLFNLNLTF